jgi:hypothetical protein
MDYADTQRFEKCSGAPDDATLYCVLSFRNFHSLRVSVYMGHKNKYRRIVDTRVRTK